MLDLARQHIVSELQQGARMDMRLRLTCSPCYSATSHNLRGNYGAHLRC